MGKEMNDELYQAIQEFMQSYIDMQDNMRSQKVINVAYDKTIEKLRNMGFPKERRPVKEVVDEMIKDVYSHQALMQHPRCYAFIPSPASPLSWLGDMMTSAYNPHAGSWLQSSSASCMEQEVIKWLCHQADYPNTAGGLFVSGGSMANLTALIAARNAKLSENEYGNGVIYVSEQTHSSVGKGLKMIGFRADQITKIPCDDNYRMEIRSLERAVSEDRKAGRIPFAVVATAGTTNTGSIDPINDIANLCEKENLWLHVDGAYGASVLVSDKFKHLLHGISRADSISWDAHKWLMQTYSCSAVLLRNKRHLTDSFSTKPEYLKDAAIENEQVNFWDLGPELTRPARSLKLWVTMQVLGTQALGEMVEHGVKLAQWAEDEIKKHENWEIVSPAQLAIVNFRYAPPGFTGNELDTINQRISQKMTDDGFASVLTTNLHGKTTLRICAIHPDATEEDIRKTVQLLVHFGKA